MLPLCPCLITLLHRCFYGGGLGQFFDGALNLRDYAMNWSWIGGTFLYETSPL